MVALGTRARALLCAVHRVLADSPSIARMRHRKMGTRSAILWLLWVTAAAEDCGVPPDRINDDYCDSADGCDEPNTSACSTVAAVKRFACPDEGPAPH